MPDFYKASGIIVQDRKLLVTREKGKEYFIAPGGLIEEGESKKQTVIRELYEEVGINVKTEDLEFFGSFSAKAAGQEEKMVYMDVFFVKSWIGTPYPCKGEEEIEEIKWVNSTIPEGLKVGSIFEHEVIPRLKEKNLID